MLAEKKFLNCYFGSFCFLLTFICMKNDTQKKKQLQLQRKFLLFPGSFSAQTSSTGEEVSLWVSVFLFTSATSTDQYHQLFSWPVLHTANQAKPWSSKDLSRPRGTASRKENISPSAAENITDPGNLHFQAQLTVEQSKGTAIISTSKWGRN